MAKGRRLTIFVLGVVAGAGALVLLASATRPSSVATGFDETEATTEAMFGPGDALVTTETAAPVQIAGIDEAIGRVLDERGFAERIDRAALEQELDASIVRVLIGRADAISVAKDAGS